MEMKFINVIGELFEDIFGFMFGISPGYMVMLLVLTIGTIVVLYFRFFTDLIKAPYSGKE